MTLDTNVSADTLVSRVNLKRYVQSVFYEDNRLWVITSTINGRTIKIKDFLWEFFQGNKGKPPRILVERVNPVRFTLTEFPEGMEVDESLARDSSTSIPSGNSVKVKRTGFTLSTSIRGGLPLLP